MMARNLHLALHCMMALAALPALAQGTPDIELFDEVGSGSQRPALAPEIDGIGQPASPLPLPRAEPAPMPAPAPVDQGTAATLLADQITLSPDNVLTASGNVVVWHQGARLTASTVIYDSDNDTMRIEGPLRLTRPALAGTSQEATLIADAADLDNGMRDGILRGARLVLAREMQMAARELQVVDEGRETVMEQVVASSCRVCASNPTPLWEIRARRIVHDRDAQTLRFTNPQFRAFGLPILTVPGTIRLPDPSVQRMTGFLNPRFRTTSNLGFGIQLPYFITLGDHADLTVTPYLAANRTTTLGLHYRQALVNGAVEWHGALSRDDIRPEGTRGYLFGAGRFELADGYVLGLQLQHTSDRAYLLDYDISDADRLWSGATLEKVRRDRLLQARAGIYDSLREDEPDAISPSQVADFLMLRRFQPDWIGGWGTLEWSAHAHRRPSSVDEIGRDMARLSTAFDWQRTAVLPHGLVGSVQAGMAADLYAIRDDSRYKDFDTRLTPYLGTEIRYPLARHSGSVTQIIEPVLQILWSSEPGQDDIPNEDSTLVEFDEGNLFSLSRFPGWDAREGGLRANLGVSWTRLDQAGWSIGVTAGRIIRQDSDAGFSKDGPLGGYSSDWLLATNYSDDNGLSLSNRALFNDDLVISRDELRVGWQRPGLELSMGYLWLDADAGEDRTDDVSELTFAAGWQLRDGWWANAETRHDFVAAKTQKAALGVSWRNECVTLDMEIERRFTTSDSVRPETSFGLAVRLGGFGQQPRAPGTVARQSCMR